MDTLAAWQGTRAASLNDVVLLRSRRGHSDKGARNSAPTCLVGMKDKPAHIFPLHALHNQSAIDCTFKPVMPDGLIGGALIPCLGRRDAREFRDHDTLDGIAF